MESFIAYFAQKCNLQDDSKISLSAVVCVNVFHAEVVNNYVKKIG